MSFAWPSFRSTPLTISQQSFAPGVSHILGALSVLKMRHAFMLLPSKSDFQGPAFAGAGWIKAALSSNAIVRVMRVGISRRQTAVVDARSTGSGQVRLPATEFRNNVREGNKG